MHYLDKLGVVFCILGGLLLFVSLMGCCGALRQVRCMLGMYSMFILLILMGELAVVVFVSVMPKNTIEPLLQRNIRDFYVGDEAVDETGVSTTWDLVMYKVSVSRVSVESD